MNSKSTDNPGDTVRLLRPPSRVFTEARGQNVWMGEVEVLNFELVEAADYDPYNSADAADI